MKVELNERQKEAVRDFDHNLLVTAGAGTGKTRVLTQKYLALLEGRRLEVPQIVAVTFTTKAADEMRARIRAEIKDFARRAAGAEKNFWVRQLEALETSAHITTIHGLCYSILTEHPVEAGLDPKAEVLEEGEVYLLQKQAAEEALTALLAGENGKEAMRVVLELGVRFFTEDLVSVYPALRESGYDWERIRDLSEQNLSDETPEPGRVKTRLCGLVEEILTAARHLKLAPKAKEHLDELAAGWAEVKRDLSDCRVLDENVTAHLDWLTSLLPRNSNKDLKDLICEVHDTVELFKEALVTGAALAQLPVIMEFMRFFDREYQSIKRRNGKIDFADQQLLTRKLLTEYPEIAAEYRERFAYFLIDEVQDTNSLQWEILSLLIGEDFPPGRFFLVGDIKQSIYRFRGAEVEVITGLASQFQGGKGRTLDLEENYRTLPQVAGVINGLCRAVFATEDFPYHPLVARREAGDAAAVAVEVLLIEGEREAEPLACAARIRELVEKEEIILKSREGERAAGYGDIALLFRAKTNMRAYEEAFRRYGIPFVVNVGSGFYSRQEIQDQLSLLRLVACGEDSLSLAEVLRSPFCGLSDPHLFWLARPDGLVRGFYRETGYPEEIPAEVRERIRQFRDRLVLWQRNAHLLSIPELLRLVQEETGYLSVMLYLPDGERRLANLEKFLNLAEDFVRKGYSGVREFVTFLERLADLEVREGEAPPGGETDVVRMMTVHAAKGLEFPVVVLPELGHRFKAGRMSPVFFHKKLGFGHKAPVAESGWEDTSLTKRIREAEKKEEISELKRLFYVALTRAGDYLLLAGSPTKKNIAEGIDEAGSWLEWLRQVIPGLTGEEEEVNFAGGRIKVTRWDASKLPSLPGQEENSGSQLSAGIHAARAGGYPKEIASATGGEGETVNSETAAALPEATPEVEVKRGAARRVAVSPLLTFMRCPRRFYWEHRLGTDGTYLSLPEIPSTDGVFRGTSSLGDGGIQGSPAPPRKNEGNQGSEERLLSPATGARRRTGICQGVLLGNAFHRLVAGPGYGYKWKREEWEKYFSVLPPEEQGETLAALETMRRNYLRSPFFPPEGVNVYNEYPFLLGLKGVMIKGTIDRILIRPDGRIQVIDFKTNQKIPGERLLKEYVMQISLYSLAVREIFGRLPDENWIYFVRLDRALLFPPDEGRLKEVEEEILQAVEFISTHDEPEDYLPSGECDSCPFIPWCSAPLFLHGRQRRYGGE